MTVSNIVREDNMELILREHGYELLVDIKKLERSGRLSISIFTGTSNFELRLNDNNAKKLVEYLKERFK